MMGSLTRIRLIAGNTFLEAIRQKFFSALFVISVGLLLLSRFFQNLDFGTSELNFIVDFGFGQLFFFGSVLSIVSMTQLFFNEIESRTVLPILSKPVRRVEFLIGKWLGVQIFMLIFTGVISLLLAGILFRTESALRVSLGEEFPVEPYIVYGEIAVFGCIQWIKFGVICSISLLIGSFSNSSLFTMMTSFFVLVICQTQHTARNFLSNLDGIYGWLAQFLSILFPNFKIFEVGHSLVIAEHAGLPFVTILRIVLYGLVYTAGFLLLAQVSFRRREI